MLKGEQLVLLVGGEDVVVVVADNIDVIEATAKSQRGFGRCLTVSVAALKMQISSDINFLISGTSAYALYHMHVYSN